MPPVGEGESTTVGEEAEVEGEDAPLKLLGCGLDVWSRDGGWGDGTVVLGVLLGVMAGIRARRVAEG